jgi:hypothetical protein
MHLNRVLRYLRINYANEAQSKDYRISTKKLSTLKKLTALTYLVLNTILLR